MSECPHMGMAPLSPYPPSTPFHTHKETKGTSIYGDTRAREELKQSRAEPQASASRSESETAVYPADDPSVIVWARLMRGRFGDGVKLFPDRYAYLGPIP